MPEAEAEEPEKDAVMDKEAVDDAEEEFSVAEQSDGGGGVMCAVDKGEAVEYKHERGCEAVVTLQEHCQAEQSACDSGYEEVQQRTAHGLVEGEMVVLPFRLGVGHNADGAERDDHKRCSTENGGPGATGSVEGEVDAPSGQPAVGLVLAEEQPSSDGDDRGVDTYNDYRQSTDGLKTGGLLHKVLYLVEGVDCFVVIHVVFKSTLRCKVTNNI